MRKFIATLSSTPRRNQLSSKLEALKIYIQEVENNRPERLKKEYGEIEISKAQMISFLRIRIKQLFREINRIVDTIFNPMDCYLDIQPPSEIRGMFDNKPVWCNGSKIECKIKIFFNDNKESFDKIYSRLKEIPDKDQETKKRIKSLKEILRILPYSTRHFSNHSQNQQLYWNCGDAIIAITAPNSFIILNRNEKHYIPICESINKISMSY